MNRNSTSAKVLFVALVAMLALACNAIAGGNSAPAENTAPPPVATEAPVKPADTPVPAPTKAPPPTATEAPRATATEMPPAEPASIGEAVSSSSYEVTVLEARELKRVYMGKYYHYPEAGHMFVEVIVKVTNLTGSTASVPWKNVGVKEESGDSWYPNWAGYKAVVTGKKVDGSTIGVNDTTDGTGTIDFKEDAFLRAIWYVTKNGTTTLEFGFDDVPIVAIMIE
jgi:hypothetical protein